MFCIIRFMFRSVGLPLGSLERGHGAQDLPAHGKNTDDRSARDEERVDPPARAGLFGQQSGAEESERNIQI